VPHAAMPRRCAPALLAVLAACSSEPYTSDQAQFNAQVQTWGLAGISEARARSELEKRGFKVSVTRNSNNIYSKDVALFATQQQGFPVSREWRVIVPFDGTGTQSATGHVFLHGP